MSSNNIYIYICIDNFLLFFVFDFPMGISKEKVINKFIKMYQVDFRFELYVRNISNYKLFLFNLKIKIDKI